MAYLKLTRQSTYSFRMATTLVLISVFLCCMTVSATSETWTMPFFSIAGQTASCVQMQRSTAESRYLPGQPLDVTIRMESECTDAFTAFGIFETIPAGWKYVSGESVAGNTPAGWPETGNRNVLKFFWIVPPVFPLEIRYTIEPDTFEASILSFSGYCEFRLGEENEANITDTINTELLPLVEVEGELPLEGEVEGEFPLEGEVEGEPDNQVTGCRKPPRPSASKQSRNYWSGDNLLLACTLFFILAVNSSTKSR
jgi:hypothetical protein